MTTGARTARPALVMTPTLCDANRVSDRPTPGLSVSERPRATRGESVSRDPGRQVQWPPHPGLPGTPGYRGAGVKGFAILAGPRATMKWLPGLLCLLPVGSASAQEKYDLLLRGGHVLDPRNKVHALCDVAVRDGKIAAVAPRLDPAAALKTV